MKQKALSAVIFLVLSIAAVQIACGGGALAPTYAPVETAGPLDSVDSVLQEAASGHIVYNTPETMQLDESVDIQLLLSPSKSTDELKKLIIEAGQVQEGDLIVTPLMKAELRSEDPQAFLIQGYHDSPEQVILKDEPTEWRWAVAAKKSGNQVLTLTLYRQVKFKNETYWRLVEAYQSQIHITVSVAQRLKNFDWQWLLGVIIPAVFVPLAAWLIKRVWDKRKKLQAAKEK